MRLLDKVAIIGGAGYIGTVLSRKLLGLAETVVVADNLSRHGDGLFELVPNPKFKFCPLDITDYGAVRKFFDEENPSAVILLSSLVGVPACNANPYLADKVNDEGWANVADVSRYIPLVGASTESVYGPNTGKISEKTVPSPNSIYATSKYGGDYHVRNIGNGKVLRFVTCIGPSPAMRLNLLPHEIAFDLLTRRVATIYEGNAPRNFIDIQDFCDALIWAIVNFDDLSHDIYNVGTPNNVMTKKELAENIQKYTGGDLVFVEYNKDEDGREYQLDFSRIEAEGFEVQSLESRRTIENIVEAIKLIRPETHRYQ